MSTERNKRRAAKVLVQKQLEANPCNECTECCTLMEVEELKKPERQDCQHQDQGKAGCAIYKKRPQSCRDFFCAYRYGVVGKGSAYRPDELGIIFDVSNVGPPGILLLNALPIRDDIDAEKTYYEVAAKGAVIRFMRDGVAVYLGAEERVKACQEHARKRLPLVVPKD